MTGTSIEILSPLVIARSAATKQSIVPHEERMDCFASLAMTGGESNASVLEQQP
ncbi:hypothetical protein V1290_006206 [Bradyrhizobium sp. AZCC 1578]